MRGTLPVAGRILRSLAGDRPTLAFLVVTPFFVFFLFGQVLDAVPSGRLRTDFLRPAMLSVFVFILTYVLTGIGFLRERQRGTLERLLTTRATRGGLVLGYFLGFGAMAVLQSTCLALAGIAFLSVTFPHGFLPFYAVELLGAATALGLGILVSVLARTELQVVQAIPLILAPQVILGGVFVPVDQLPDWLRPVGHAFPLSYLLDAMARLVLDSGTNGDLVKDVAVLAGFALASAGLAALALRRKA